MKKNVGIFLAIGFVAVISAQGQTDYAKEIEKWRSDREANLKKKRDG